VPCPARAVSRVPCPAIVHSAGCDVPVPYISRLVPGGVRVASCKKMAMKILVRILVIAAALAVAAWVVPGIQTEQWSVHGTSAVSNDASIAKTLIIVAVIFGLINAILKPIIKAVGCAFYVLTLGLIAIVVNGALLYLTSYIAYDKLHQPFHVTSFVAAVEGALIVGIVTWVAHLVLRDED
jgi:putative membrane protein